jgi:hypothetical protein
MSDYLIFYKCNQRDRIVLSAGTKNGEKYGKLRRGGAD